MEDKKIIRMIHSLRREGWDGDKILDHILYVAGEEDESEEKDVKDRKRGYVTDF
ncbi:MAG: hypothetical protein J6O55_02270 [Lachnospiraceae bacterium]|nr:hypothetical protein [Lachnospiraceae bacterium]